MSDGLTDGLPDDPTKWSTADRAMYGKRVRDAKLEYLAEEHEPEEDYGELDGDGEPLTERTPSETPIDAGDEPPWADPPDLDRYPDAPVPVPRPDRPPRRITRRRRTADTYYAIDGEEPPDDALHLQRALEHSYGRLLGQDLHGSSTLLSWSDPIGDGRESRRIEIRFPLNEALQPRRSGEFSPHPDAAFLFVSVTPEDALLNADGDTRRTYNGHAWIADPLDRRIAGSRAENAEDSPVTAARVAIQDMLAAPLSAPLRTSDDRPFDELPYDVRPAHEKPITHVPPGFLPKRFHALYYMHYGLKWLAGFIALLAIGIPIAMLVRNGPSGDAVESSPAAESTPAQAPPTTRPAPLEPEPAARVPGPTTPVPSPLQQHGVRADDGSFLTYFLDPPGGLNWSIPGTSGIDRAPTTIEEVYFVIALLSNPMLSALYNNSAFPCGAVTEDYRVTCPLGAAQLSADDEYFVIGVEHAGPVGVGADSFTYGLAFDDDGDESDNYQFAPPFTADFFRNTEHWYQLHIDADGTRRMWADGARDGTLGHPRFSSALVIETGNTIVWVIPRSEVPGDQPAFRVTAFHNNGDPSAVPNPETSGGDVSGEGVLEPLTPIGGEPVVFDNIDAIPPDIDTPIARVDPPADPDAWIAEVLTRELEDRLNAALAEGDVDAVAATVHPALISGPNAEACRAEVEATIALADTVEFTIYPGPPDTSSPLALYSAVAQIRYPTGAVDWGPLMTPGPQGRFFLVLPSCA